MTTFTLLDAARAAVAILETSGYLDGDSTAALRLIAAVQRAELSDLQTERDRLAAELDALRNAPPALPAPEAPAEMPAEPATKRRFRAKEQVTDGSLACAEPGCNRTFKNAKALGAHRARTHGEKKWAPTPKRSGIRLVDDTPIPFRCEVCHRDTFARDLHQPDRCIRCAKQGAA